LNNLEGGSLLSGLLVLGLLLVVGVVVSASSGVTGGGGIIAGGGGAVGRSGGTIAGLRSAITAGSGSSTGSEEVNAKEVDGQEGQETQKDGLRDQVDGVAGAGEVQSAFFLALDGSVGGESLTGEKNEAKGGDRLVHCD